mmetsp:Transcript_10011/g.15007  ORF Transcript_10011/g.15007 Transcript_10011/m.15007 type:complete len:157 (+) Transcript_10011:122-592(+)
MGKGSNASKIARARADAAKRAAKEGKGGGGKAGMLARKGGLNQEEALARAKKERELKMQRRAEKEAKRKAEEAKKAKERAKALAKNEGSASKKYPPKEFIEKCLNDFYSQNAPDKLGNLGKIMEKYDGKWAKLEAGLKKKFPEKAPDFCKLYSGKK